jgi:hypothetical protein
MSHNDGDDTSSSDDHHQQREEHSYTQHTTLTTRQVEMRRSQSAHSGESDFPIVHAGGGGRRHHAAALSSEDEHDDDEAEAAGGRGHHQHQRSPSRQSSAAGGRGGDRAGTPDSSFMRDLESGSSSRIGDSRSIVLALRSLQEKIRKLEADRDFHRDQCETARRAHEAYKADVEDQLHRDRVDFRRRESELQDLIARAKQEQQRLTRTLDDSRLDAGAVSSEVAQLLERERREATARDARLKEELETYRKQITEERLAIETLQQQVDQARAERDILETTNRRLEHTVKDLLSMNKTLVQTATGQAPPQQTSAAHERFTSGNKVRHLSFTHNASAASQQQQQHHNVSGRGRSAMSTPRYTDPHHKPVALHHERLPLHIAAQLPVNTPAPSITQPPMRFQSPTLASIQHRAASQQQGPRGGNAGGYHRSSSAAHHQAAAGITGVPCARAGSHADRKQHHQRLATETPAGAVEPLDAVYRALEAELRALNKQYREVIDEANASDCTMGPEVLTARLNGIMVQIDRKSEQLRLLRASKASAATEDVRQRPIVSKGYVKATHKTQQMNAIRELAANVSNN